MNALDDDTITVLAMQLCCARNDPTVSGHEFIEMLISLVQQCVLEHDRYRAAADERQDDDAGAANGDSAPGEGHHDHVPRRRLSYDDKVRMRAKYDAALEGRCRAPRGWLQQLAAEFGTSVSNVKSICYRKDGT